MKLSDKVKLVAEYFIKHLITTSDLKGSCEYVRDLIHKFTNVFNGFDHQIFSLFRLLIQTKNDPYKHELYDIIYNFIHQNKAPNTHHMINKFSLPKLTGLFNEFNQGLDDLDYLNNFHSFDEFIVKLNQVCDVILNNNSPEMSSLDDFLLKFCVYKSLIDLRTALYINNQSFKQEVIDSLKYYVINIGLNLIDDIDCLNSDIIYDKLVKMDNRRMFLIRIYSTLKPYYLSLDNPLDEPPNPILLECSEKLDQIYNLIETC